MVTVDADAVARAAAIARELLVSALPNAWIRSFGSASAEVTGLPMPTLNGVFAMEAPDRTDLARALETLADTGLPYCVQLRPGYPKHLGTLIADRGLLVDDPVPVMATDGPVHASRPSALRIRRLEPSERWVHITTVAAAFEAPPEGFGMLITKEVAAHPAVSMYVGEVNGEPVSTALGFRTGEALGIFNVGTLPAHVGSGFGSALTAHATDDGFGGGARWAWLQSSAAGLGVYARLGFTVVERAPLWTTPHPDA